MKELTCLNHAQGSLTHFNYAFFQPKAVKEFPPPPQSSSPLNTVKARTNLLLCQKPSAVPSTAPNGLELRNLSTSSLLLCMQTKCNGHFNNLQDQDTVAVKSINSGTSLPKLKFWFHVFTSCVILDNYFLCASLFSSQNENNIHETAMKLGIMPGT